MKELVIESLSGRKVGRVAQRADSDYLVKVRSSRLHALLDDLIKSSRVNPIPMLTSDLRVRTTRGELSRSMGAFYRAGDVDFLDALADVLAKYDYFAYTVEASDDE